MTIDENGTITIYNGDYGLPIVFETVDFAIGDKVVFVISNKHIQPKEFTVDTDGYTFNLAFSKAEAVNIAAADHLEHLISIGIDVTDFENEVITT